MGDPTDFSVAVELLDDCALVHVAGELDLAHAPAFEDAVGSVDEALPVILDLWGCTFIDSSGVRVIAGTLRRAPRVDIVATDPAVVRTLELTGVHSLVTIHSTLDAAL